jgi:hypothetical protein
MKKRRALISVIVIVLIAFAVVFWLMSRSSEFMRAEATSSNGSHYEMQLPAEMEPASMDSASLHYEADSRELYVMVIDESKAKIISFGLDYDLETYMKIASRTLDSAGLYVNKPTTINGYKALQTEIKADHKGKKIVYRLTCIETPKFFYQVLTWTLEERYEGNKEDMETIVASFKEIEQ